MPLHSEWPGVLNPTPQTCDVFIGLSLSNSTLDASGSMKYFMCFMFITHGSAGIDASQRKSRLAPLTLIALDWPNVLQLLPVQGLPPTHHGTSMGGLKVDIWFLDLSLNNAYFMGPYIAYI